MNLPTWYENRLQIIEALQLEKKHQPVCLAGFLRKIRKLGKLCFVNLVDATGDLQLVFQENLIESVLHLRKESVIAVYGIIQNRKSVNLHQELGEWEMVVEAIRILSPAEKLTPFVIDQEIVANEDTKLTYRYLEMRSGLANRLKQRHLIINCLRAFLNQHHFCEVETPILGRSTPEGARDYLVPVRTKKLAEGFALPQSPQLYKQLLMIGGLERYFQLARNFRDEDLRADRQPEFTQLDLEVAYWNTPKLMRFLEAMFANLWQTVLKLPLVTPFPVMSYHQCIQQYGTDKPDLRFGLSIEDFTSEFMHHSLKIFANAGQQTVVKGLFLPEIAIDKKKFYELEKFAQEQKLKGIMYASSNPTISGNLAKLVPEWTQAFFVKKVVLGTIFLVCDTPAQALKGLGAIRNKLGHDFQLIDLQKHSFLWIVDWPLFEWDDQAQKWEAAHHPFTMPQANHLATFEFNQAHAQAEAYDLVLNGIELGSGSKRIHTIAVQQRMFQALNLTKTEVDQKFGWFLEAFNYGVPPHQGIGLGIDRILQIIFQTNSIRDVIAFPKNNNGVDAMQSTPAPFKISQLDLLNLQTKVKE